MFNEEKIVFLVDKCIRNGGGGYCTIDGLSEYTVVSD